MLKRAYPIPTTPLIRSLNLHHGLGRTLFATRWYQTITNDRYSTSPTVYAKIANNRNDTLRTVTQLNCHTSRKSSVPEPVIGSWATYRPSYWCHLPLSEVSVGAVVIFWFWKYCRYRLTRRIKRFLIFPLFNLIIGIADLISCIYRGWHEVQVVFWCSYPFQESKT